MHLGIYSKRLFVVSYKLVSYIGISLLLMGYMVFPNFQYTAW